MACALKILNFMAIEFFVSLVDTFPFSKFHENEAKLDKDDFKRGLAVTLKVKNS